MLGEKQHRGVFEVTIEDPEKARRMANFLVLLFAGLVFVRGYHAHAGFALVMSIFLSASARTLFEVVVQWGEQGSEGGYGQRA